MSDHPMRLLVSVRNAEEALVAVEAGVDIIDIKDPDAGPLGFAGWKTIDSVLLAVEKRVPVSAALGEAVDWLDGPSWHAEEASVLSADLRFIKMGLAGLHTSSNRNHDVLSATATWQSLWSAARQHVDIDVIVSTCRPEWVAVAYADFERADAPGPWDVFQAAADHNCTTLLIDTYVKDGRSTLDWLSVAELQRLCDRARTAGLRFVLAGQLTEADLEAVFSIRPDVMAVRGAVCEHVDRRARLCARRIRDLQDRLCHIVD